MRSGGASGKHVPHSEQRVEIRRVSLEITIELVHQSQPSRHVESAEESRRLEAECMADIGRAGSSYSQLDEVPELLSNDPRPAGRPPAVPREPVDGKH